MGSWCIPGGLMTSDCFICFVKYEQYFIKARKRQAIILTILQWKEFILNTMNYLSELHVH